MTTSWNIKHTDYLQSTALPTVTLKKIGKALDVSNIASSKKAPEKVKQNIKNIKNTEASSSVESLKKKPVIAPKIRNEKSKIAKKEAPIKKKAVKVPIPVKLEKTPILSVEPVKIAKAVKIVKTVKVKETMPKKLSDKTFTVSNGDKSFSVANDEASDSSSSGPPTVSLVKQGKKKTATITKSIIAKSSPIVVKKKVTKSTKPIPKVMRQ